MPWARCRESNRSLNARLAFQAAKPAMKPSLICQYRPLHRSQLKAAYDWGLVAPATPATTHETVEAAAYPFCLDLNSLIERCSFNADTALEFLGETRRRRRLSKTRLAIEPVV